MSFADRRAQRRWRREMERRLRELDRLDAEHGLGASPTHRPIGPIPSTGSTGRRPRKERGPALPGLIIALLVIVGVFMLDPSDSGRRLRELVGLDGRLGELVGIPDGEGEYAFAATQPAGDEPVSWNPCRPIRYVVNPDGAPDDWEDLVADSVRVIEEASGFEFEDQGTSEDRDFDSRVDGLGRPAPVLIGWAGPDEVPRLSGDVAGLGGSTYLERGRQRTYVTGSIALDAGLYGDLEDDPGGGDVMRAILTHELGHVLGLDHVDDRGELMYSDSVGQTELGPGDLEGLARLGAVDCG